MGTQTITYDLDLSSTVHEYIMILAFYIFYICYSFLGIFLIFLHMCGVFKQSITNAARPGNSCCFDPTGYSAGSTRAIRRVSA